MDIKKSILKINKNVLPVKNMNFIKRKTYKNKKTYIDIVKYA